jgi:succinate dehydrogenase/fumarate reductase flavoprotein subunit
VTTTRYDVVVAGAGMAGLVAALTAAQEGARVLLLEKGGRPGGSMLLAHGFIGTLDTLEAARRLVPGGDETLQDLVISGVEEARQWLVDVGVKLGELEKFSDDFSGRLMEPQQLTAVMLGALTDAGAELRTHAPLHSLTTMGQQVSGVAWSADGQLAVAGAGAAVLATGGFQGDPELVQRYITPHANSIYLRAQPYSTGDGLQAALSVGGTTSCGMSSFYGHAMPAPPTRLGQRELLDATQRFGDYSVAVNRDGFRFVDETGGSGEETVNEAVALQPGAEALYIVDAVGAAHERGFMGLPSASVILSRVEAMGAPVLTAHSLDDLASQVSQWGFHAEQTLQTLRLYNDLVEKDAELLSPPRRGFQHALHQPPFRAVLVRAGITFTSGGIAVDPTMAVIARSSSYSTMPLSMHDSRDFVMNAVPGLFAAGADVGGIHVGGYMGGLATALVTGRAAGASAAEFAASVV